MPVSKTRAQLVDVARQLFAKMGVENTTMNDIALASKKGRRTLYTYFKSKEDIYLAVVESQLDILLDTMKRVADKHISPDEKMLEMIYTRLDVVKEVVYRNGTLRADFFRDIWKVEKARKRFDEKEVQLFKELLREGMEKGVFQIDDLDGRAGALLCERYRGALHPRTDRSQSGRRHTRQVRGAHRLRRPAPQGTEDTVMRAGKDTFTEKKRYF